MIAQAQLHPDPDAAVQRELGHLFADLRPLYHGRLASVYLARDVKSRATVALKTILRLRFLAPGNASRFRRQTVAAARLDHPNIVSVHRHGVSPSFLWYSMDYCPGGPLSTVQPMAVIDCVRAVQHIGSALDHAHRSGTVHADLRPFNVLLDESGAIRVSDFGILRSLGGVAALETKECPPGSLDYIAPEQLVKDGVVGPPADQYALGVLAYEYLAGRPVFGATSAEDLVARRAGPPPELKAVRPDVPSRLAAALQRALSEAPADRFMSVADFAAAVTSPPDPVVLWPEEPTPDEDLTDDEDAPDDAAPRPRGKLWRIIGVVAALLVLGAGVWFASSQATRSRTESGLVRPLPVAQPEPRLLDVERAPPAVADPPVVPPAARPATPRPTPPLPPALVVVSSVPWAELYVDGRLVGNTPVVDLQLRAGRHRLRLQRAGFRPYEEVVTLAPGQSLRMTGVVLQQETAP
ncbi:MAG TPA: serine/threonine-protein kinase [Gemmatimonadales bacterium]|nr:serine/threonine-protein kinase [Gemmatimonadales bacterium]